MVRFVIQCDTSSGGSNNSYHFDLTIDVPELEKVLKAGGRSLNGDFERYSLKMAYVVLDKDPITAYENYLVDLNKMLDGKKLEGE